MLEMNCYKQFRTAKAFADAEVICQNNGGFLAKPVTLLQVNWLEFYCAFEVTSSTKIENCSEIIKFK